MAISRELRESCLMRYAVDNDWMTDGEAGLLLTRVAAELDLPAPVDVLSSGSWGTAWNSTHPRQVIKITHDNWEIATYLAVAAKALPKRLLSRFAGCVHIEVIRTPVCWHVPDWHARRDEPKPNKKTGMCLCPSLAFIWKERVDTSRKDKIPANMPDCRKGRIPGARSEQMFPWELLEDFFCDAGRTNNGYRGKRVPTLVTFDGRLMPKTLIELFKERFDVTS